MKTAEELKIKPEEYEAVRVVREGLASGLFVHVDHVDYIEANPNNKPMFDMEYPGYVSECGSVGCIGAWVATFMDSHELTPDALANDVDKVSRYVLYSRTSALAPLFYPEDEATWNWSLATPADAVEAIDNFLETGSPNWDAIAIKQGYVSND